MTDATMANSPLLKFPPEIRNTIYELIVDPQEDIEIPFDDHPDQDLAWTGTRALECGHGLASTCRQTRAEFLPLFFSRCQFIFHSDFLDKDVFTPGYLLKPFLKKLKLQTNELQAWFNEASNWTSRIAPITLQLGRWPVVGSQIGMDLVVMVIKTFQDVCRDASVELVIGFEAQCHDGIELSGKTWFFVSIATNNITETRSVMKTAIREEMGELRLKTATQRSLRRAIVDLGYCEQLLNHLLDLLE